MRLNFPRKNGDFSVSILAIYANFNKFVEIVVRPMQRENSLATRYEELLRRLAAEITKLRGVENLDVRADGVTQ